MSAAYRTLAIGFVILAVALEQQSASAADQPAGKKVDAKKLEQCIDRGIQYLLTSGQA